MGLLEKAEKIQSDEDEEVPSVESPATVAVPEPVQKKEKPAKKSRSRRERTKKAKKERVQKVMPDGFEKAGRARSAARYFVDLLVNYGLMAILWGFYLVFEIPKDPTIPLGFTILLAIGNLYYLPSKFSSSTGNIISGTKFVNTRGDSPSFLYHISKGANIPIFLLGIAAVMLAISSGTDWEGPGNKIFVGVSMTMLIFPIIDRFMSRRAESGLGLWDTLFGGVWLVTAEKAQSDSGIIQRLQSIGEYAEQRGMLTEDEGNTE